MVSSEDDAEVRRVSITNLGARTRDIQVTSYAELSLTRRPRDVAHPAFANLFVETEFVADLGRCWPRAASVPRTNLRCGWRTCCVVNGETVGDLQYETDRARFLGRGRGSRNPISVIDGRPLSNTVGSVLDPAMIALRRTVRIPPGNTAHLVFSTIVASTREQVLDLADKYRDARGLLSALDAGLDPGASAAAPPGHRPGRRRICSSGWPMP